jgi:hypothetical protein
VNRQPPTRADDAIELYVRTYASLLRSSGDVPVRAFEEAHLFSDSALHSGARDLTPDVAAFAYSAARLPACMPRIRRIVLGQSHEQFEGAGLDVRGWPRVRARGRRRPMHWDGGDTLAVFVTSASDVDDLVPIVTAWQIEWNKLHTGVGNLDGAGRDMLREALGADAADGERAIAERECDLTLRLLSGTWADFQRAAQRWWSGIEPDYLREEHPRRRPVYIVSSNMHSVVNLLGGFVRTERDALHAWVRECDPEGLASRLDAALARNDAHEIANLEYWLFRTWLKSTTQDVRDRLRVHEAQHGITTIAVPGKIDVDAQIVELGRLEPTWIDPRVAPAGVEKLKQSDAVVLNIDYPLGMAAYHHLSRIAQGVGEIRGIYVMGKAATLNARVGDVMISSVVQDAHSRNTYLFKNCFRASDVQPFHRYGSVLDNQRAVTVRGAFLQNRETLGGFYHQGYTVLEMEGGPFLSAVHEIVNPSRHPDDELVHLSNKVPFDLGLLHYASDTPYSRRQSLLSKSLSFFGVESTYACAIAIVRRILQTELAHV